MPRTAIAALALSLLATAAPATADAPAHATRKNCGTYKSSSTFSRARVIAIRGVGCREARRVARRYDHTGNSTAPWQCFLAHGGGRRLFSCGYPATGGDIRESKHALTVR